MKKIIEEGEAVPWGYGAAWRLWDRRAYIAYPVPLNLVLRWLRDFYFLLVRPAREEETRKAWKAGYDSGKDAWYGIGKRDGKEEFSRELGKAIIDARSPSHLT